MMPGRQDADTAAASSAYIDAHRSGDAVWVDMIWIPEAERRQGRGRALYEEFEKDLPADIKYVLVFAADTDGCGNSDGFWSSLGFEYRYRGSEDALSYEAAHQMVKGVNGTPTPEPAD